MAVRWRTSRGVLFSDTIRDSIARGGGSVEGAPAKGALKAALRHRDFRTLLRAQTISDTGNWLYSVALIVYVLEETGSAGWVAATSIIRFLPMVLLGPIGGAIADRYDRRSVMIAMDLARAVLMAGLALVALADTPALLAILLAAGSATCSVPYYPSVAAAVPLSWVRTTSPPPTRSGPRSTTSPWRWARRWAV